MGAKQLPWGFGAAEPW